MMKTIIIYTSNHGCTEGVVMNLKEKFSGDITTVNLKKNPNPDISEFGRVIIGGSIHMGQIQKKVREYCDKNMSTLEQKEIGLFICCMAEGQEAKDELKKAFPERLHQFSKTEGIFGGEYNFDRMNFIEKMVIKKAVGVKETTTNINHKAIDKFVKKMEKTFQPLFLLI